MLRRCVFLLVALALLVPAGTAAAAKSKSVTLTFSGSGGTETDTFDGNFRFSPTCSTRFDGSVNASNIAWKAKFKRVPIPKKGQTSFKTVNAKISGSAAVKFTEQVDPGCGQSQPEPPIDCIADLAGKVQASLTLVRKGSKLVATADLFPPSRPVRPDQQQTPANECPEPLREDAFMVKLKIPASGKTFTKQLDQSANDKLPEIHRAHYEIKDSGNESGLEYTFNAVSDIAWTGALTAAFARR